MNTVLFAWNEAIYTLLVLLEPLDALLIRVALSRVGTSWDVPEPFRSTYIFEYFLV